MFFHQDFGVRLLRNVPSGHHGLITIDPVTETQRLQKHLKNIIFENTERFRNFFCKKFEISRELPKKLIIFSENFSLAIQS